MYVTMGEQVRQLLAALSYSSYLRGILIATKTMGVLAILSRRSVGLCDLANAGMLFHLLLAFAAHVHAGDGGIVPAVVGLIALALSYYTQNAARTKQSPYPPSSTAARVPGSHP